MIEATRARNVQLQVRGRLQASGQSRTGDRFIELHDCYLNDVPFRRMILYTYDPEAAEAPALSSR